MYNGPKTVSIRDSRNVDKSSEEEVLYGLVSGDIA